MHSHSPDPSGSSEPLRCVGVCVFRPLRQIFTYLLPESISIARGGLVEVPFGRQKLKGIVWETEVHPPSDPRIRLKSIHKALPPEYQLREDQLQLAQWISNYYQVALGEALTIFTAPSPLLKSRDWPIQSTQLCGQQPALRPSQLQAIGQIEAHPINKTTLLHGVTGSGKTEVYLHFIDQTLTSGQSCIFLLPEITLTRETLRKLKHRYQNIIVFHSGMTPVQRRQAWLLSKVGGPHLIVGARSGLFCPVADLGLIVVDEEHDSSFKQDSTPRYHARDCAIVRGGVCQARVILGSATPSLETYRNAKTGKYTLVEMHERISDHPLPKVHVVDLTEERKALKRQGAITFSRTVLQKTKLSLLKKKQVIFFLNRRGFSTAAICPACGEKVGCPHCSVTLTHYRRMDTMICHHCDFRSPVPTDCPRCQHRPLMFRGTGTERLHEQVEASFPTAQIIRVDGSVDGEKDIQDALAKFMEGDGDILLGTQIISKGLDSPDITLSVALNADLGLSLPDFRAAEKDFQLLTQLAGRVGRGAHVGECVFQTHDPEHYAIRHAIEQDYPSFYKEESHYREQMGYPPFTRLARFVFQHSDEKRLIQELNTLSKTIRKMAHQHGVTLLGPAPAPLQKVKTRHRWHLVAKSPLANKLSQFLTQTMDALLPLKRIDWYLDRDPHNMM